MLNFERFKVEPQIVFSIYKTHGKNFWNLVQQKNTTIKSFLQEIPTNSYDGVACTQKVSACTSPYKTNTYNLVGAQKATPGHVVIGIPTDKSDDDISFTHHKASPNELIV